MIVESWDGFKWNIREGEEYKHDSAPLSKGELSVLKALTILSRTGTVFVDVGAHVGYYTVRMAKLFTHVYGFEPNPTSRENLLKNLQLNNIKNVTIFPFALGSKEEKLTLHLRSSSSTLLPREFWNLDKDMPYLGTIHVDVKRMDDVIDKADVVKIDVEGYEWEVIKGMTRIIQESKPSLIIEHHEMRGYKISLYKHISRHLRSNNYIELMIRPEHRLYYHRSRDIDRILEIVYFHWINHCIQNLQAGRPWYYGLPYTWWWGMQFLDFILELREHINREEEWVSLLY